MALVRSSDFRSKLFLKMRFGMLVAQISNTNIALECCIRKMLACQDSSLLFLIRRSDFRSDSDHGIVSKSGPLLIIMNVNSLAIKF